MEMKISESASYLLVRQALVVEHFVYLVQRGFIITTSSRFHTVDYVDELKIVILIFVKCNKRRLFLFIINTDRVMKILYCEARETQFDKFVL
jgi:hypothetical protein